MNTEGEYRFDEGAIAEYDQIKAQALEKLRGADGFVIVCGSWEGEEDLDVVVSSATRQMNPAVFMAIANEEVAKLTKKAVILANEEEVEEIG
jgi:hypothetical protein